MRVHCELPRFPAPTDAALHRVKALDTAASASRYYEFKRYFSQRHPPVTPPQNLQTPEKLPARRCQHDPGTCHVTPSQQPASHNVGLKHISVSTDAYLATLNQHRYTQSRQHNSKSTNQTAMASRRDSCPVPHSTPRLLCYTGLCLHATSD
jgi:hypothetical protein